MVIRDKSTNNKNFSLPNLNPGNSANKKSGINICIKIIHTIKIYNKNENMLRAKLTASILSSSFLIFLTNIGTKAELKAPSANILRKKFGNLNAAKNTSERRLTPINFAINTSLMKPRTLDIAVKIDIVKADLKMAIIIS